MQGGKGHKKVENLLCGKENLSASYMGIEFRIISCTSLSLTLVILGVADMHGR
jgi:hypothetical protein